MRGDWLGTSKFGLSLEGLSDAGDDALVRIIIRVDVGALGGAL